MSYQIGVSYTNAAVWSADAPERHSWKCDQCGHLASLGGNMGFHLGKEGHESASIVPTPALVTEPQFQKGGDEPCAQPNPSALLKTSSTPLGASGKQRVRSVTSASEGAATSNPLSAPVTGPADAPTPRTDAVARQMMGYNRLVPLDFARALERELTASNAERERWLVEANDRQGSLRMANEQTKAARQERDSMRAQLEEAKSSLISSANGNRTLLTQLVAAQSKLAEAEAKMAQIQLTK